MDRTTVRILTVEDAEMISIDQKKLLRNTSALSKF